jgi:hypothetical protein
MDLVPLLSNRLSTDAVLRARPGLDTSVMVCGDTFLVNTYVDGVVTLMCFSAPHVSGDGLDFEHTVATRVQGATVFEDCVYFVQGGWLKTYSVRGRKLLAEADLTAFVSFEYAHVKLAVSRDHIAVWLRFPESAVQVYTRIDADGPRVEADVSKLMVLETFSDVSAMHFTRDGQFLVMAVNGSLLSLSVQHGREFVTHNYFAVDGGSSTVRAADGVFDFVFCGEDAPYGTHSPSHGGLSGLCTPVLCTMCHDDELRLYTAEDVYTRVPIHIHAPRAITFVPSVGGIAVVGSALKVFASRQLVSDWEAQERMSLLRVGWLLAVARGRLQRARNKMHNRSELDEHEHEHEHDEPRAFPPSRSLPRRRPRTRMRLK